MWGSSCSRSSATICQKSLSSVIYQANSKIMEVSSLPMVTNKLRQFSGSSSITSSATLSKILHLHHSIKYSIIPYLTMVTNKSLSSVIYQANSKIMEVSSLPMVTDKLRQFSGSSSFTSPATLFQNSSSSSLYQVFHNEFHI